MRIVDSSVQERDWEFDTSILHRPLFPVNMRIYKSSPGYRKIIKDIVLYMIEHLMGEYEDYSNPRGYSGANAAIPFNIVVYKNKGQPEAMLNPEITNTSTTRIIASSNCGALRLKRPIQIYRYEWVDVKYYDMEGDLQHKKNITADEGGYTLQHECDHLNGVLIVDRAKEQSLLPEDLEYYN